jgi:hypothetical protein
MKKRYQRVPQRNYPLSTYKKSPEDFLGALIIAAIVN